MKKRIIYALIGLLALCSTSVIAEEVVKLKGLNGNALVRFDENGIPSIEAESIHDVVFAQGWVHARDRLWQMDINRRRSAGRMAELFGKGSVNGDYNTYLAGLPQVSSKIWAECLPAECDSYQAYADGVNAYIANMAEPPEEYLRIGVVPEAWSPVDSVAIGRGMSWGLSSDLGLEIMLGVLAKTIGNTLLMDLLPIDGVDPITIVGDGSASSFPAHDFDENILATLDQPIFTTGRMDFGPGRGSNNWVVSGTRAANGAPLLSSDTHMGLSQPCDWYEVHLKAPGLHVAGLSVPGAPGILIGHNEKVAWGVTQARFDVSDAYVEKLDPARPDTHYLHKDESVPFDIEKVSIKYKTDAGFQTEERTILRTVHGPVVYEADRPKTVTSFRWTGHEPTHEGAAFFGFMVSNGLDDFKSALDLFEVGAQNFVYADVEGNIYYRSQGKIPLRKGKPFLPLDGSSGNYEWRGYVPYDRLPSAHNPVSGFVATANNRQAGDDYPYYIGAIFDKGYRARRISDLILSLDKVYFEDMQAIQYDVYSLAGQNLLPVLYSAVEENEDMLSISAKEALGILKAWDLQEIPDATAPLIFYQWLKHCTINIFKDNIPEEVFSNLGRTEVMYPMILRKKNPIIDVYDNVKTPDIRETKNMILTQSLNDAIVELEKRFGLDKTQWNWGKLHQIRLGHQLGGEFSVGPEPAPGGSDTINVADFGLLGNDFNFGHGPNMRFTVEMSPGGPRAANIIAGGQSGNRLSPNYADQFLPWIQGKTHPMLFKEADIAARTIKTIVLTSE
jgi:penicillin amidase